jgi:hypothetical protein
MKLDSTWKKGLWNMLSRLKLLSAEAEAEETKGEVKRGRGNHNAEERHTKNTQDSHNSLKTHRIKEEEGENGQTNPEFNATIAKSMVTMRVNAERSSQIKTKAEQMSPTMKEKLLKQCFFHAIPLKKVTPRTFGCWTMLQQSHDR